MRMGVSYHFPGARIISILRGREPPRRRGGLRHDRNPPRKLERHRHRLARLTRLLRTRKSRKMAAFVACPQLQVRDDFGQVGGAEERVANLPGGFGLRIRPREREGCREHVLSRSLAPQYSVTGFECRILRLTRSRCSLSHLYYETFP
jgi:hypothetical protein